MRMGLRIPQSSGTDGTRYLWDDSGIKTKDWLIGCL